MKKKNTVFLAICIGMLFLYGLAILASAQVIESQKEAGESYYFLKHQLLVAVMVGIPGLVLGFRLDYRVWKKLSLPIFILSLILMGLVFTPQLGLQSRGASRWISFGGISFQPSEIAKLGIIIYFAAWLSSKKEKIRDFKQGFIPFLLFNGIVGTVLALQPDIGTLGIISATGGVMFFLAGGNLRYIFLLGLIGAVGFFIVVAQAPYRMERVLSFLNPHQEILGRSYQLHQSLIGLGSGGVWGKGYAQSVQKQGFLPEVMTDSIFSVLGEELGFIGCIGLIIMLVGFLLFGLRASKSAPDLFGQLLGAGIVVWIGLQSFFNMAAMTGLVPLSGLPLPFVSLGGTALVVVLFASGILLNISEH